MDFQPIDTVPCDGTPVVLRDLDGRTALAVIRPQLQGHSVTLVGTTGYATNVPSLFQKDGSLGDWLKWAYADRA